MQTEVKCPAAVEVHPPFSQNKKDVLCRIQGNLRPATTPSATTLRGTPVVCCAHYAECRVWQTAKQIEEGNSTGAMRRQLIAKPHSGVLKNATRDRIAVN